MFVEAYTVQCQRSNSMLCDKESTLQRRGRQGRYAKSYFPHAAFMDLSDHEKQRRKYGEKGVREKMQMEAG